MFMKVYNYVPITLLSLECIPSYDNTYIYNKTSRINECAEMFGNGFQKLSEYDWHHQN